MKEVEEARGNPRSLTTISFLPPTEPGSSEGQLARTSQNVPPLSAVTRIEWSGMGGMREEGDWGRGRFERQEDP